MRCMNCDAEINEKDKFCENCGTSVEASIAYHKKMAEESAKKESKKEKTIKEEPKENTKEKVAEMLSTPAPKKKKKHRGLIVFLIIALLACCGAAYYFFIYNTPKRAFTKTIDMFTDKITSNLDDSVKSEKGRIKVKAKVSVPSYDYSYNYSLSQVIDILNDMNFVLDYEIDRDKKFLNYEILANYEGESMINIDGMMNEYSSYYRFDDSQKYIKQRLSEDENIFKYFDDIDDTKKIITGFADALKDSIDDKYIEKESAKIKVDGKEVSTTKNTLLLNRANAIEIAGAFIDSISENDDVMELFAKSADMTADQFKASLGVIKADLGTYIGDISEVKVSVYTKGFTNDFVRLEFEVEGQKIGMTEIGEDSYTFDILGEEVGRITTTGTDNDKECEIKIGYGEYKVVITLEFTRETNVGLHEKDIFYYIDSEDVTSSYYETLLTKLNNNKAFKKLYNYLSSSSYGSYSNSYYLYD